MAAQSPGLGITHHRSHKEEEHIFSLSFPLCGPAEIWDITWEKDRFNYCTIKTRSETKVNIASCLIFHLLATV